MALDAQIATIWERNIASWASRGIGIGCWEIVSGLTSQQTGGDEQNQRAGMTIHDSLKTSCFHLDELIPVHVT
jgi:hypothetical protein